MRARILLLAAALTLGGCAFYPRPGEVGSVQWVYDNADHFVDIAQYDLERCMQANNRPCEPEARSLYQAKMMQDAAGYSAMLKSGFIK